MPPLIPNVLILLLQQQLCLVPRSFVRSRVHGTANTLNLTRVGGITQPTDRPEN